MLGQRLQCGLSFHPPMGRIGPCKVTCWSEGTKSAFSLNKVHAMKSLIASDVTSAPNTWPVLWNAGSTFGFHPPLRYASARRPKAVFGKQGLYFGSSVGGPSSSLCSVPVHGLDHDHQRLLKILPRPFS